MKRLILLIIIIAVAAGIFLYKKGGVAVAGVSNNQNWVTNEKFETTLQTNLDLIYNELEKEKSRIDTTESGIAEINSRLDSIQTSIDEINSKLNQ